MIETREPEINIDELKARVRLQVERREAKSLVPYAAILAEFDRLGTSSLMHLLLADPSCDEFTRIVTELTLQTDFVPRSDDHYRVKDFLDYDDQKFVWTAYVALLKREPDEEGFTRLLDKLRAGQLSKIDILARLRYSPEGKRMKVTVDGLLSQALISKFYRLSVPSHFRTRAVNLRSKLSSG
jgi:hypothetical protein